MSPPSVTTAPLTSTSPAMMLSAPAPDCSSRTGGLTAIGARVVPRNPNASGAAIKARARSVLGTLWGVEDNSARLVMERFYRGLLSDRLSKAQALRQSQIELIRSGEFAHPFFWAPFVLVGNWL